MTQQKSKYLMGFDLRRRSGLPNASAFVAHQACHCCFYMIFLAFPAFFLDTMEATYNMDPSLSIYPKKSPFKPMCCLLSRFLAGPLGYTVRPPGKNFFCHPSQSTNGRLGPNGMPRACWRRHLRETSRNGPPGGIISTVKDILSKYELNEGQNN